MSPLAVATIERARLRPLPGVDDQTWERFVSALSLCDVGANKGRPRSFTERRDGYGCFGLHPRRLVDLKVASGVRTIAGKAVSAVFAPTKRAPSADAAERAFLASPSDQYDVLFVSLALYDKIVAVGALPAGMTRSGALALYHRLGPHAIEKWAEHKERSTVALFERTNGLF